mmetsp:Transcript_104159/g.335761  ORF Transcript_104159/g.335761 Transcript_104159/m.335761 type:complete len:269 (-) Transcript_104159:212-1018(-)
MQQNRLIQDQLIVSDMQKHGWHVAQLRSKREERADAPILAMQFHATSTQVDLGFLLSAFSVGACIHCVAEATLGVPLPCLVARRRCSHVDPRRQAHRSPKHWPHGPRRGHTDGQCQAAASAVAADKDVRRWRRLHGTVRAVPSNPAQRCRAVLEGRWKQMFRCHAVVHRQHAQAADGSQTRAERTIRCIFRCPNGVAAAVEKQHPFLRVRTLRHVPLSRATLGALASLPPAPSHGEVLAASRPRLHGHDLHIGCHLLVKLVAPFRTEF